MKDRESNPTNYAPAREFYDHVYHAGPVRVRTPSRHLRRLSSRFRPWRGKRLLDVACGTGEWLMATADQGARVAGVDLSRVALAVCRAGLPHAELYCGPAETLGFKDGVFDFVSCLGALEHFADPGAALKEMRRVAKPSAEFLLSMPNAGFLTRRLGWYSGTEQIAVREDARTIPEWESLLGSAGLRVVAKWRDLHVLSRSWIARGPVYAWPLRFAQAAALPLWPVGWQYQVYFLCKSK